MILFLLLRPPYGATGEETLHLSRVRHRFVCAEQKRDAGVQKCVPNIGVPRETIVLETTIKTWFCFFLSGKGSKQQYKNILKSFMEIL